MTLATLLAASSVLLAWLGSTSAARWLARRDHRCVVRTRSASCGRCVQVRRGEDMGGHVVCACAQASPHLVGADLLRWRAEHQSERFPGLPGEQAAATRGPAAVLGDTDRAQAQAFDRLAEGIGEAQRRAIARARANPDPLTPQLLREADTTQSPSSRHESP